MDLVGFLGGLEPGQFMAAGRAVDAVPLVGSAFSPSREPVEPVVTVAMGAEVAGAP